jgi:hypothetical protein
MPGMNMNVLVSAEAVRAPLTINASRSRLVAVVFFVIGIASSKNDGFIGGDDSP